MLIALLLTATLAHGQSGPVAQAEAMGLASTDPQQVLAVAAEARASLDEARSVMTGMLEQAERKGDAAASACLQGRLDLLTPLVSVARQAQGAVTQAVTEDAAGRAAHELRKLLVARDRGQRLLAEAQACSGSDSLDGQTTVDVAWAEDYSEVLPQEDPEVDLGVDPGGPTPFE